MARSSQQSDLFKRLRWRRYLMMSLLMLTAGALMARAVQLQVIDREFYVGKGDARQKRVVAIPAHRGMIVDRQGEPLAMSTPVDSVWANPKDLLQETHRIPELAGVIGVDAEDLKQKVSDASQREFVYLKRHLPPHIAEAAKDLSLPGVGLQREYRRYYPTGEVTAHLLGFTNIDDHGQEGLELAYNHWLEGKPGSKRVMRDRLGRPIADIELMSPAEPGQDLALSIDRRVQYLAYRALKGAVKKHQAKSGSLVMLDAKTGEVIAMVNQPAYNPNNRRGLKASMYRNRAITDVFEPGSTMKPLTIAAALESGEFQAQSIVNTAPGRFKVGKDLVKDPRNHGWLDMAGVIKKSSNVGASKIALELEPEYHWSMLSALGFGQTTGTGFPGETAGYLHNYYQWSEFGQATLSFGYGLSVSALQLAHAYTAIANDGYMLPTSFQKGGMGLEGKQVLSRKTAQQVRRMMQKVVSAEGTAPKARVHGYQVAGKTGTVHKNNQQGGYDEDRYVSLFAGMAPASDPRFVTVVMINEPQGQYYGGQVAAPIFSEVMSGALRLMDVMPDQIQAAHQQTNQTKSTVENRAPASMLGGRV